MKKMLSIIFICVWTHLLFAAGPTKVPQLEDAYAEAQNTKQKIVVVFGAEWCGFCKRLDSDIAKNPEVLNDYIYVYIDIEDRKDLKKEYKVKNIPDIMILNDGVEIKRTIGYKNIDKFQKWLDE